MYYCRIKDFCAKKFVTLIFFLAKLYHCKMMSDVRKVKTIRGGGGGGGGSLTLFWREHARKQKMCDSCTCTNTPLILQGASCVLLLLVVICFSLLLQLSPIILTAG